jgi:hypothetical protein
MKIISFTMQVYFEYTMQSAVGIPRWWLEGGSRKHASYSEILER